MKLKAPGPTTYNPLGYINHLRYNPLNFLWDTFTTFGDIAHFRLGHYHAFLLAHPQYIKYFLYENNQNFSKEIGIWQKMQLFLGNGLLTSEGNLWQQQRKRLQPCLYHEKICNILHTTIEIILESLENWQDYLHYKRSIDLSQEMRKIVLRIVAKTMLSFDIRGWERSLEQALSVILYQANDRISSLWEFPRCIPTKRNRQFYGALHTLDLLIKEIVKNFKTSPQKSLLSSALSQMEEKQLHDEIKTILLAGHETIASALSWSWYLLDKHSSIKKQLCQEVSHIPKDFSHINLPQLKLCSMVFKEAMRLYPPAWMIGRLNKESDVIGGYDIPKNSIVIVSQYVTHKHPSFWKNPHQFDPWRFSRDKISSYTYFPFGAGAHTCIGNHFAMIVGPLIMAMILKEFHLEFLPQYQAIPAAAITLRPKGGMPVFIRALNNI